MVVLAPLLGAVGAKGLGGVAKRPPDEPPRLAGRSAIQFRLWQSFSSGSYGMITVFSRRYKQIDHFAEKQHRCA
jgi:hypothetical protein